MRSECGQSLVEVLVSAAIASVALAAFLGGTLAATHRFGPDPVHVALERTVHREMRIAVDLLKYQGGTLVPAAIATTVPMPGGSPIPVRLSLAGAARAGGGVDVTLTATSDTDAQESVKLHGAIPGPVPLPGSSVPAPAAAAAPN
jgi:hypothetical protein